MKRNVLLTMMALAAFGGGTAAADEYKVVRVDLPNGSPVFGVRRVNTPATIAVYSRDGRSYRTIDRARSHDRERTTQMQVGNAPSVTFQSRPH